MGENKEDAEQLFEIFETCEVKRKYRIKAKTAQEALDEFYNGGHEPYVDDEEGNEVWVYDEKGNACAV